MSLYSYKVKLLCSLWLLSVSGQHWCEFSHNKVRFLCCLQKYVVNEALCTHVCTCAYACRVQCTANRNRYELVCKGELMSPCILSTCSYLYTIPPPSPPLQALSHSALLSHFITHTHTPTQAQQHCSITGKPLVSRQIPEKAFLNQITWDSEEW